MKYYRAEELLPNALLEELQTYLDGAYLYIPRRGARKGWGELSGSREELMRRNREIRERYRSGESLEHLADAYWLSISTLRQIVKGTYKTVR